MPQTNYLPLYTASYPILARVQKPGGVTVSTTVGAGDVPNKPTYVAGTVQSFEAFLAEVAAYDEARTHETKSMAEEPENEEEEYDEDDGNGGTVKRKRTVTRTRTTTRRR